MPELNAKLFGTPAVSVDGREITLPYKKADALLYYLILKRKTTRSELIGLLYEDTDSATALKNLRHAIYTIRKAFAFFRPKYDIDCNGWHVEGDFLGWDYQIRNAAGQEVAVVSKELFNWTDTYSIDVYNPQDALYALMLVLAIDAEKCSRN